MTTSNAGSLSLVGGVLALDFTNTASGRETGRPFEHLRLPEDLVTWGEHAGAINSETAERCRNALLANAPDAEALLHHGFDLRDAIYRIAVAIVRGGTPSEGDLRKVKETARRAMAAAELAPAGGGYALTFSDAPPETAILGPIAWSAIQLVGKAPFDRLKQCTGDDCGWLFLDQSKNNSRRWCDMATCGNRTKGKRHRQSHH